LLVIVWSRFGDIGDRGLANVISYMSTVFFLLLAIPWFAFFSAFSRRIRFGLPLAGLAVVVLFFTLFSYSGVDGSMVPRFAFRYFDASVSRVVEGSDGGELSGAGIDLRTTAPDDFPGFLGAERSGIVPNVRLARDWNDRPPQQVWRRPIGEGWSAFSIVNGYAVTMEQRGDDQVVSACDAQTGEPIWSHAMPGRFSHVLGGIGPRSTPTIDEGRVYALGARGRLVCLDGATGRTIWEKDLLQEYGVTAEQEFRSIQYGRSNSPLVFDDLVIIPAGGNVGERIASLAAFDKRTGEMIWEGGKRQISFSSPRRATLAGVEQVLIVNENTMSGHDPVSGEVLWEHPWPGRTASDSSSSQAVPVPPDRVFVSKGYGGGALLVRLSARPDGRIDVTEVWRASRVLRTKFTQVVIRDGYVYGLSDGTLECADLESGERIWKKGRYGHGQILGVGDLLLILSESGELSLIEPTPDEPNRVLGRIQALEGLTWNNLALSGDLLLVRNSREAAAFRLPLEGAVQ
jgi:outer membrane protein assembly factor BamB